MTIIHSPRMFVAMDHMDDQRAWLEELLKKLGITATELARQANLNPSTLTRFLQPNGRDGHMLSARTVQKIRDVTQHMLRDRRAGPGLAGFAEDPPRLVDNIAELPAELARAIAAMRAAGNAIDAWEIRSDALSGLRIHRGDVLMVDMNATAQAGDIVCVQKYDWNRQTAETVFRLFEPPYLLTGQITGPARRPDVADNQTTVIRGVVIARLSPRGMLSAPAAA